MKQYFYFENRLTNVEGQTSTLNNVIPLLLDTFELRLMHRDIIEWKNRLEVGATATRIGIQIFP